MTQLDRAWPDVAISPGETLAETLEVRGMSQVDLARRMGRPTQMVNEIVRGGKEITAETALQLESVLGTPAHVWTRLEADYRFVKARLTQREELKKERPLAGKCPYAQMAKLGWVARTGDRTRRVQELLSFFGVASLRQMPQAFSVAYRRSAKLKASAEALAAWLRQGEREAERIDAAPFDEAGLYESLGTLRGLTRSSPAEFVPQLRRILAEHGVVLVFVPHLPRTGAHGATRWLGNKAVVQMSLRYAWGDIFWFTLFHELGHVLRHSRREIFVEGEDASTRMSPAEVEADRFAADVLIPPVDHRQLTAQRTFSASSIQDFADAIGVAPSIVVGRLQHDGLIEHSELNWLRPRFEFKSAD
jgi:HTH-type transcriptional regulator/antitoxin HigA